MTSQSPQPAPIPVPRITKAPKQFFIQLANQLCSIQNSPFMRIGQQRKPDDSGDGNNNRSFLRQTMSIESDRLFNPEKYKEKQMSMDQSYLDFFKEKEQEEMFKIQYDLLKKNANQEYNKEIEKVKAMRKADHKQPYTWFGVYRGPCQLCGKCGEYQGCFSQSQKFAMGSIQFVQGIYSNLQNTKVQLLQCIKCQCPMNTHTPTPQTPTLRPTIFTHLTQTPIHDTHLSPPPILLSFKLPQSSIQHCTHLLQTLNSLNCPVIGYRLLPKLHFEIQVIKCHILQNSNTEKYYMEALLGLLESVRGEREWAWGEDGGIVHEMYDELYGVIRKLGVKYAGDLGIGDKECVIVVMCRYQGDLANLARYLSGKQRISSDLYPYPDHSQSTQASTISSQKNPTRPTRPTRNLLPNAPQLYQNTDQSQIQMLQKKYQIHFIHTAFSRKESVLLSQCLFKESYEIGYSAFLVPGGVGGGGGTTGEERRELQRNWGRVRDVLDYNSYTVVLENVKNVDRAKLQDVMARVLGYPTSKIAYILGPHLLTQSLTLPLTLTLKPGPQTLTLPSSTPDLIRISNTHRNEIPKLLNIVHPEFNHSQRCLIIVRPFLVGANFEEIVVNLLRINGFVLIKVFFWVMLEDYGQVGEA